MNSSKAGVEPCWIDHAAMTLGRPWVFIMALGFILTPSSWLLAAANAGAAFLKIGTGARPTAMGGAYTALAHDVDAIYYNPGGLGFLARRELGATHAEWLLGTKFDFIGYAQPTAHGTFGLGVTRLSAPTTEGRGANREATAGFEASDTAYSLSYSRLLRSPLFSSGNTSLGGNVKLLQSTLGQYSASAVALDMGIQHRFTERPLSVGMSVLNVGKGMRFLDQTDPLPLTIAMGGAYWLGGALNVALDVRHEVYDKRTDVGIGSEYALLPNFSLRMGYASQFAALGATGSLGPLGGMGAGFGLRGNRYRADYTFTPFGDLGNVQRISLGARW